MTTCTHALPQGCCRICAAAKRQEQTPQEHRPGGLDLITKVVRTETGFDCKVFAIGGRLLDEYDAIGLDYDGAIAFVEWMAEQIREGADWADWRESQNVPAAVQ